MGIVIKPTVGRVVNLWLETTEPEGSQPFAATIAFVHSDRMINVGFLDHNGQAHSFASVQLVQEDDAPTGPHARWMEYQKGQAAKTEALEAKLSEKSHD